MSKKYQTIKVRIGSDTFEKLEILAENQKETPSTIIERSFNYWCSSVIEISEINFSLAERYSKKLLNKLLDKYERSKISKSKTRVFRDISLKFSDPIFDGHRNYSEVLDLAIKRTVWFATPEYKDGLLTGLVLDTDTSSIEKLYSYLNRRKTNEN